MVAAAVPEIKRPPHRGGLCRGFGDFLSRASQIGTAKSLLLILLRATTKQKESAESLEQLQRDHLLKIGFSRSQWINQVCDTINWSFGRVRRK
jgi:hypothetical protein